MSQFSDHKEVVRIQVKKMDGWLQPEIKNLCVDPQITSYEMLQNLLARAFDIRSDFTISYLATDDTGEEVYLSLLSDWDLDAAFFGASNPVLRLKVDVRPFEEAVDDWELVAEGDSRRVPQAGGAAALLTTSSLIIDGLSKTVSSVTKAFGLRIEEAAASVRESAAVQSQTPPPMPVKQPLSDAEFHLYLDAVGRLVQPQQFRVAVYQGGVESSLRPVVWRHLLNIYPGDMNGRERFEYVRRKSIEYYRLRDEWLSRESTDPGVQMVAGMVRKDVHRTDRLHAFYAGDNNPNGKALFNLLVTFALTHPLLSYWQGMSDIASPILAVQTDEATSYVCFCALMRRLGASFAADGGVMATRFRQLALLVRHFDAEFYSHICRCGASDMFFTYRWLLLEMKREFPLDDAMYALEVMWSSLPLDPPDDDLPLYDAAYLKPGAFVVSPVTSQTEAYVHLRSTQRRLSGGCSQSANGTCGSPSTGCQKSNGVVVSKSTAKSASSPHSADRDMPAVNELDEGKTGESSKASAASSVCKLSSPPASKRTNASRENEDFCQPPGGRSSSVIASSQSTARVSSDTAANRRVNNTNVPSESISSRPEATTSHIDDVDGEDADEETKLLDDSSENVSLSYVQVSHGGAEIVPLLPPPSELGCGNPFLMFLCLSTLLLQRSRVMATCVDYNDVAMHYDKMVRQHRVEMVVQYARQLYAAYLKQQQQQQQQLQSLRNDADDEHECGDSHDN